MQPQPSSTFVLGVGCQKGGTAWLHDYLNSSSRGDFGFMKEYHVWDTIDQQTQAPDDRRMLARAQRAVQALRRGETVEDPRPLRQASFVADPESYFDYFASLVQRVGSSSTVTGDLTPAYSSLSPPRMAQVRDGMAQRGVRTVALFSMRDPVDRLWSAVRMKRDRKPDTRGGADADLVRGVYRTPEAEARSRYDLTLDNVRQAFPRADWHAVFFEQLFTEESTRALCEFLGIEFHPPALGTPLNTSTPGSTLPEDLVAEVARHYRPVYDAAAALAPGPLAEIWSSARYLD